jgi:hypothetical protein
VFRKAWAPVEPEETGERSRTDNGNDITKPANER